MHVLALLFVLGVFTRVTFLAFAIPIVWQCLSWTFREPANVKVLPRYQRVQPLLLPASTAILASLAVVLTDTSYFRGELSSKLAITPLNFVVYNMDKGNLAEHGVHPHWLHLVVNLPMMVGPPLVWLGILAGIKYWETPTEKKWDVKQVLDRSELVIIFNLSPEPSADSPLAMITVFVVSLTLLSIQPHQEPRFLMAFLGLFIVFVGNSGYLLRMGRTFWVDIL